MFNCKQNLMAMAAVAMVASLVMAAPLIQSTSNSRYFEDDSGNVIYITGAHTHDNLQDMSTTDPPPVFNFDNDCSSEPGDPGYDPWDDCYLDFLDYYDHNFTRGWAWEQAKWCACWTDDYYIWPLPFKRTGPGNALDGKLKFDLTKYQNTNYFDRLYNRADAADNRGMFISIMLFEGWSIEDKDCGDDNPWNGHPMNPSNNINSIDGDTNNDGEGHEVHTLSISAVTNIQEDYVEKTIDELNSLDNIVWNITNESHADSVSWQYHIIDHIQSYEAAYKSKQHLVWMENYEFMNSDLFISNAEIVSPNAQNGDGHYKNNPAKNTTDKIVILDTDHLWGWGGDRDWTWKAFCRGYIPMYMDPLEKPATWPPDEPRSIRIREAIGETIMFADRLDLAQVTPQNNKADSSFCLADVGEQYLVFQHTAGNNLTITPLASGEYYYEWFDVVNHSFGETGTVTGTGSNKTFTNPYSTTATLYVVNIDDGISNDLGKFNDPRGLRTDPTPPSTGDTIPATIGGRECQTNETLSNDKYMYFDIEDDWAYQGDKTEVWVTIEYYDNSTSGYFRCAYDGTGGFPTQSSNHYLTGTDTWKTHTWHITDAYFGNRGTSGNDFRIFRSDYSIHFYLDKVSVSDTDPNPGPPGQATNPSPANSATLVSIDANLSWTAGSGATSHDVYFGTDSTPDSGEFKGNQSGTTYDPGTLSLNTTYYWRIDEVNGSGTTTGTVWSFTTEAVTVPTMNVLPAGTITIDGSTSDWSLSEFTSTAHGGVHEQGDIALTGYDGGTLYYASKASESVEPTSASDHTAKVYSRHDSTYQYFLVRCDDDDIQTDEGTQGDNWKNDCVEFYIDPSHNHGSSAMSNSTSDIQLVIDAANRKNVYMCTSGYATQVLNGVTSAVSTDASGWYLEVRIDKSALDPDIPDSGTLGVDFNYRDNDDSNNMTKTTIYSWSDDSGSGFPSKIPDNWGDAELEELTNPPGQASDPSPANSATDVSINSDLSWTAGSGATSHDVYFGTDSTPDSSEFQGNQAGTTYDPGSLSSNTTYYWRIDEVNGYGTTTGVVWSFTTLDVPGQASNPSPANSATDVSISADLSWTAGSGATSHDVYFGTSSPGTFQGNQGGTTYDPGTMSASTTYYWRIDEVNEAGTTTGTVWSFTTAAASANDAEFV
ncbi:MAG: DUF6298 domain-containing protein, partial [Planctomycetota bacterium]